MLLINLENAAGYLRDKGWLPPSAQVQPLSGGVSNLVLQVVSPDRTFVIKQSRPQLRTREAWFSDINRVFREVEVMRLLGPLLPRGVVPNVLFVDEVNFLYAMSAAPLESMVWKQSLLGGQISEAVARYAGLVLGLTHERTAGRPDLIETLGDRTVFHQLRTDSFYERIRERLPDTSSAVTELIDQLHTVQDALCHGDFSPKNFLVHPLPAYGPFTLVDYETGHYGDPTMDLGFFLSHLILKAIRDVDRRQRFLELTRVFWKSYAANVQFRSVEELERRAIVHFAVCALARIDGTSPVDYLPEEPKRDAVRALGRRVLQDRPGRWTEVLEMIGSL
jgi:5-methylthioribose kinase